MWKRFMRGATAYDNKDLEDASRHEHLVIQLQELAKATGGFIRAQQDLNKSVLKMLEILSKSNNEITAELRKYPLGGIKIDWPN